MLFIILFIQVSSPVYLKIDIGVRETGRFTLIADEEEIASSDSLIDGISMWISSFYIFNLEYPTCLKRTLAFLQKIILNIQDELAAPRPVVTLTNKLNFENARLK